jgi:hypothetical protein
MKDDSPLIDLQSDEAEPFSVTPGFIAFLGMLILPVILAVGIYAAAAVVADDVYAADASAAQHVLPANTGSDATARAQDNGDVAGWKRTLVGVCPLH